MFGLFYQQNGANSPTVLEKSNIFFQLVTQNNWSNLRFQSRWPSIDVLSLWVHTHRLAVANHQLRSVWRHHHSSFSPMTFFSFPFPHKFVILYLKLSFLFFCYEDSLYYLEITKDNGPIFVNKKIIKPGFVERKQQKHYWNVAQLSGMGFNLCP